jgi:hypothetical protein
MAISLDGQEGWRAVFDHSALASLLLIEGLIPEGGRSNDCAAEAGGMGSAEAQLNQLQLKNLKFFSDC